MGIEPGAGFGQDAVWLSGRYPLYFPRPTSDFVQAFLPEICNCSPASADIAKRSAEHESMGQRDMARSNRIPWLMAGSMGASATDMGNDSDPFSTYVEAVEFADGGRYRVEDLVEMVSA